jgi:hypothetical protein
MLSFGNLLGLAALAGLIVPIAIHLLSKKQIKPLQIGSIIFLQKAVAHKVRNIQIRQIPLLLLRCLVVAWWALVVAFPFWETSFNKSEQKKWLFVASDVNLSISQLDSLQKNDVEVRWLTNNFPVITTENLQKRLIEKNTKKNPENYWKLISSAEKITEANKISKFSVWWTSKLSHYQGNIPKLSKKYHFKNFSNKNTAETSSSSQPNFFLQNQPKKILILYDEKLREDLRYLNAALETIKEFTKTDFLVQEQKLSKTTNFSQITAQNSILFFISESPLNEEITSKKCRIFHSPDTSQVHRVRRYTHSQANVWAVATRLNEKYNDFVVEPVFLDVLLEILFENKATSEVLDQRKISYQQQSIIQNFENEQEAQKYQHNSQKTPLHWWFLGIGIGLIALERYVSRKKA